MKKLRLALLIITVLCLTSVSGFAYTEANGVILDGKELSLGVSPIVKDGRTLAPARSLLEELGFKVKWEDKTRKVIAEKDNHKIELLIDNKYGNKYNGVEISVDVPAMILKDRTFIPVRVVAELLGFSIKWDNKNSTVVIKTDLEQAKLSLEDEAIKVKIDDYMKSLVEYQNFNGNVLIAKEDKVILNKGYGYANIEAKITNKPQTRFAIGSVTKQFTAMGIMQLSEKNLLNVEDKVSKYIPELKEGDKLTIHNLLTHTSGLKNYTDLIEIFKADTKNKDPMMMVNLIKDMPLEFKPGEQFQYSNTNYLLLGMIIEKLTGESFEDYLEKNILKPLDMKDTGVSYGKNNQSPNATPYSGFMELEPIDDSIVLNLAFGAGNMYSTTGDLSKWDLALKTEKLVSKETVDKIFKNYIMFSKTEGYGYGWMVSDTDLGKRVKHGGNTLGFTSIIDRYIDKKLTIIALTNKGYYDVERLADDLKNISQGKEHKSVEHLEEIEIKDKALYEKYIGKYKLFEGADIYVTYKNGNLYAQVTGQPSFQIFPQTENKFFAKIVEVSIEFISNDKGETIKLNLEQMGQEFTCEKIEQEEFKEQEQVYVDSKIYEQYVGDYELAPNAIITITKENEKIYAKLTGQEKYEIFASSESEYFYKVVDAKISFIRDENGKVISLRLHQNGVDMPAIKI